MTSGSAIEAEVASVVAVTVAPVEIAGKLTDAAVITVAGVARAVRLMMTGLMATEVETTTAEMVAEVETTGTPTADVVTTVEGAA